MFPGRALALGLSLCSAPALAGIAVDLNFGQSISGTFNVGTNSVPVQQQTFALCMDYVGGLSRGLFGSGNERFGLGLGVYLGQLSYSAGGVKNTGGNFLLTARTGWLILAFSKNWLFQLTPEIILMSKLSAGSYSQTTIDGENFQSASLSSYSGNGTLRLPLYVGKKMNWKLGKSDLFLGVSAATTMQSFSKRQDTVVATSPSTGKVTSIEKNSTGSYTLQVTSLQFHLTFML